MWVLAFRGGCHIKGNGERHTRDIMFKFPRVLDIFLLPLVLSSDRQGNISLCLNEEEILFVHMASLILGGVGLIQAVRCWTKVF